MNERYPRFNQTYFTAGDEEQFESHRGRTNQFSDQIPTPTIPYSIEFSSQIRWERYTNLSPVDITNTFRYIFHKFKKGIFVQIRDNRLAVFLPFSKHNFINEWSELVKPNPKWDDGFQSMFRYVCEKSGYKFSFKSVHKHQEKWYANNGLIRYEYPIHEGDTGVETVHSLFTALCESRTVPDIEFFVNRRDFPLLRTNNTEAYTALFGDNFPLKSHNYPKYAPILSMCSSFNYADIPMITTDDWENANSEIIELIPWTNKIPVAVFRGSSTGLGVSKETNPRLMAAFLSLEYSDILDAGITKWNLRPRKSADSQYIDTISEEIVNELPLVQSLSPSQQAKFKFIVHIDGHASAFRMSRELSYGSVILLVKSNYTLWFSELLIPYVHYIPVAKDCSDLIDRIQWCLNNDDECQKIASNARKFWEKWMSRSTLLDYMQTLLTRLKSNVGTYNYRIPPVMTEMEELERKRIKNYTINSADIPSEFPKKRSFTRMKAVEMVCSGISLTTYPRYELTGNWKHSLFTTKIRDIDILGKMGSPIHECFIGLYAVNRLLQYIPNFSYTLAYQNDVIYTEYFENTLTLYEWLCGETFDIDILIDILTQIGLILNEAQQRIGFIHYDLATRNILLIKSPSSTQYYYDQFQTVIFNNVFTPILIDLEWSHAIVDGLHHGRVHPFSLDFVHDILTLLVNTIADILRNRTLTKRELSRVFMLVDFFNDTKFTGDVKLKNLYDLKIFVNNVKKFSNMLLTDKGKLRQKTAFDFVAFMQSKFEYTFEFCKFTRFQMRDKSVSEILQLSFDWNNVLNIDVERLSVEDCLKLFYLTSSTGKYSKFLSTLEKRIAESDNLKLEKFSNITELTIDSFDEKLDLTERLPNRSVSIRDWFYQRNIRIDFLHTTSEKTYWLERWMEWFTSLAPHCTQNIIEYYK